MDDDRRDIRDGPTGGHLDRVVATHEHQDHVSGFNGTGNAKRVEVDHVWLAWTENPADELAERSRCTEGPGVAVGAAALVAGRGHDGARAREAAACGCRTSWASPATAARSAADKFAETIHEAMKFVRDGIGRKPTYHKPGATDRRPAAAGLPHLRAGPAAQSRS